MRGRLMAPRDSFQSEGGTMHEPVMMVSSGISFVAGRTRVANGIELSTTRVRDGKAQKYSRAMKHVDR
jgi:hypothetical protein